MTSASAQNLESLEEENFDFENLSNLREEEIRERLDDIKDQLDAMPESEILKLQKENIELELEVYRNEHDNTGAYKFKRFGAEMGKMFNPEEGEAVSIEVGADGHYEAVGSTKNRRIIFVDMLELDRLNKEGGSHDVGDDGLNAASEEIRGLAAKYGDSEIFRSGGNQFMVDMKNLSDEEYDKLLEEMSSVRVTAKEGLEPAPLVANGVNFRDAMEDLKLLESTVGELDSHEAAREVTGLLMRSAEWGSEIKKLTKRADRVREILEKDPAKAKDFFENYVKKSFQETPYNSIDDFKQLIEDGTFDEKMRELAFDQAHQRFEVDRKNEDVTRVEMHKTVRKRIVWERADANLGGGFSPEKGEGIAEIPEETRGEAIINERSRALKAAQEEQEKTPSSINEEMVKRRELELHLEKARRDGGTGLLERGVYYEDLESNIEKGEPTTAVFVDMGFLKYFDKQGGRDVGNNGIRLAASLMEEALLDAGVEGEAYRYGGDEFTIRVKGGEQEAKKFLKSLETLNEKAGAVPAGEKSKDDYVPTGLQFSHGMADVEAMNQLAEKIPDQLSVNKKAELLTRIADTGVQYLKAADRFEYLLGEMENPEYHDPKYGEGEENAFTKQLESKIAYSNKALFSELGGDSVLRVFADEIRNLKKLPAEEREGLQEEIDDQIRRFVIGRVDASREQESTNKQILDQLVESRTRISYLEELVKDAQDQRSADTTRIKEIEGELAKTKKDFADLTKARKAING